VKGESKLVNKGTVNGFVLTLALDTIYDGTMKIIFEYTMHLVIGVFVMTVFLGEVQRSHPQFLEAYMASLAYLVFG